jgi:hypothetical protein
MEKLKKQLEDIKGALPLMIKLGAIDQSAYKTLNEALNEALQQYAVMQRSEQLIAFCDWYKTTDFNCEGHSSNDCVDEYLKSN